MFIALSCIAPRSPCGTCSGLERWIPPPRIRRSASRKHIPHCLSIRLLPFFAFFSRSSSIHLKRPGFSLAPSPRPATQLTAPNLPTDPDVTSPINPAVCFSPLLSKLHDQRPPRLAGVCSICDFSNHFAVRLAGFCYEPIHLRVSPPPFSIVSRQSAFSCASAGGSERASAGPVFFYFFSP